MSEETQEGMKLTEAKLRKARKVCEAYSVQRITLQSACEAAGVPYRTFRRWVLEVAEVADCFKKAVEAQGELYKDSIRLKAPTALEKLIDGWESTEEHRITVPAHKDPETGKEMPEQVVEVKKVKKRVGPNPTAVIFALKNIFPQSFAADEKPTQVNVNATATASAASGMTPATVDRLAQIQARTFELARARGLVPEAFVPGATIPGTTQEEEGSNG